METTVEERVDRVEIALERFVDKVDRYIYEMERDRRIFQSEMRVFKDEAEENRMAFQSEMRVFEKEMKAFKDEAEKDRKKMNKQWGELANKLGTLVEDIVAPGIPGVVKERFNIEIDYLAVRVKKRVEGLTVKEWDVIAVSSSLVFLNYTKSTLKSQDVDKFLEDIKIFRDYFPEYKEKGVIGVLASLYIDGGVIKYAEKNGLLVLGIGEEIMEILNTKDFEPVRF